MSGGGVREQTQAPKPMMIAERKYSNDHDSIFDKSVRFDDDVGFRDHGYYMPQSPSYFPNSPLRMDVVEPLSFSRNPSEFRPKEPNNLLYLPMRNDDWNVGRTAFCDQPGQGRLSILPRPFEPATPIRKISANGFEDSDKEILRELNQNER